MRPALNTHPAGAAMTPAEATTLVDIRCDAWERAPYDPAAFDRLLDALDELEVAEFAEELSTFPNPPMRVGSPSDHDRAAGRPDARAS
jgi:hypothetical protein